MLMKIFLWLMLIVLLIVAYALIVPEIKHRMTFGEWSWHKAKPFTTKEVSIMNPQHIEELMQKYDDQFTENEEYRYKEARMKDEFYGEKVYRYSPAYLPVKIEGKDVYSKLGDWIKIGEVNEEIDGEPRLMLRINEYKDVKNLEIKKVKEDPSYVLKVTKQL